MSSSKILLSKLLSDERPDFTADERLILRNALIHNLNAPANGLNVPELRIIFGHYFPQQRNIYQMQRPELVARLQTHFVALLGSDIKESGGPPPRSQTSSPVNILKGLGLPLHLVNTLERYSAEPPVEGKFVKEILFGEDERPSFVACHAGKAYITHYDANMLSVFDTKSGNFLEYWDIPGGYGSLFDKVAISGGHVFVLDRGENAIIVVDMDGTVEGFFDTSDNKQFSPSSIAAGEGLLYVCERWNHRVQIWGLDGTCIRSFGSEGTGEGEFKLPGAITVYHDEVYVTDTENHRVQVFDLDGNFRRMWGTGGTSDDEFRLSHDIIVRGNFVYLTNAVNDCVQIFRAADGEFVGSFGTRGMAPGELGGPIGLSMDEQNRMWVCDFWNNRIQLFR